MSNDKLHILSNQKKELTDFSSVAMDIHPYVTAIHIRENQRKQKELNEWVSTLIDSGLPKHKLVMNTHYDIAGEMELGGVQLPENGPDPSMVKRLYPNLKVGCSIHSIQEGIKKERDEADYLVFGNIYETACKPGLKGKGLFLLKELAKTVSIPVIAIGGINPENGREVMRTGTSGVAVMSGVMEASDPLQKVCRFRSMLQGDD